MQRRVTLKSKKQALDSIVERRRKSGAVMYDCYLGVNPMTKKKERMFSSSKDDLIERIKEFYRPIEKAGVMCAVLTPMQLVDAKAAYDALALAGLSHTLLDCAKALIKQDAAERGMDRKTVGEAYDEYYAYAESLSSNNAKTVRSRTGRWVEKHGAERMLAEITSGDVTEYLDTEFATMSKVTYNGHLQYINMFLNWCIEKPRAYIAENPLEGIKGKRVAYREPKCIDVAHAKLMFAALEGMRDTNPEYIAYAALSFFCGIRREEILRMAGKTEENDSNDGPAARIDMEYRSITILKPKGFMNGIKPRTFMMPDAAHAWLSSLPNVDEAISRIGEHTVDGIYKVARARGAVIPKNCGRHSFITYHVCAYQNFAKTLLIVGHLDQNTSEEHYRALKPNQQEGLDYFAILPTRR